MIFILGQCLFPVTIWFLNFSSIDLPFMFTDGDNETLCQMFCFSKNSNEKKKHIGVTGFLVFLDLGVFGFVECVLCKGACPEPGFRVLVYMQN